MGAAAGAGLLWTPGYWGWDDGLYLFHPGYWGPHIGFYGGVVYGFGYDGVGYEGGYWRNRQFFYNRTVNNITNVSITNVYSKTVIVNNNQCQLQRRHRRHDRETHAGAARRRKTAPRSADCRANSPCRACGQGSVAVAQR